jgi:hypothetical protein
VTGVTKRGPVALTTVLFLLALPQVLLSGGCGRGPSEAAFGGAAVVPAGAGEEGTAEGWLEVALPGGAPELFCSDETGAWAVYAGGGMLRFSAADGRWSSYDLGAAAGSPMAARCDGGVLHLLSDDAVISFDGAEAVSTPLPEGFSAVDVAVSPASGTALLSADGWLALHDGTGWTVVEPGTPTGDAAGLSWADPDWVFTGADHLFRYDPTMGLWQQETMPTAGIVLVEGGDIFLSSAGSVFRRAAPGDWEEVLRGELRGRLALCGTRVVDPARPFEVLAEALPVEPLQLAATSGIIWAVDSDGVLAWASIGDLDTRLTGYDMQVIECTMAGQTGTASGGTSGVSPVLSAASGAFRIYESVSSRPDPFTEFPARRRDLRRPLTEIAIEELRLVGITLDPAGGDQAMVEDVNGVPYILYVETQLANNTRVAEITSNEVIVVQEVTVDYGPEHGGTASIPTIYTMRLHEEGGL